LLQDLAGVAVGAIRRILSADDFSSPSRDALGTSLVVAERLGAAIRAVHVRASQSDSASLLNQLECRVAAARALEVEAEAAVVDGDVVEQLLHQALDWDADLIVVGAHGRRGPVPSALGSVTEALLHRAPCSVLVISEGGGARREGPGPFMRILCPHDFSDPCQSALEYALSLLSGGGRPRFTLLHVIEGLAGEGSAEDGQASIPEYRLDLSNGARERLRGAIPAEARGRCEQEETVAVGRPHQEILRVARERGADLIVLGVHGRRAHDRQLYGTTLCHVVREARCSVLAVRPHRAEGGREPCVPIGSV
jgi:nucleotide-binding universal stress UspA family protein